jgi:dTDP-4-amino-4,6-dideoxygalactose transaminase
MINVPLQDLKAQYAGIRSEIREAMDRVCDSQEFILGREVDCLEGEVATFCGVRWAIGVSSGTDALLAALMAIGVGNGDEVITSAYSFFATAGSVARLGARPVFVDIDPRTFNLRASAVRAAVTSRTKVILPVHLFGGCADMDPILQVAGEHKLAVIEDAAQALGAHDEKGRAAGTIGSFGCFSFFPSKNLGAFGDGGMVVTNDETLGDTVRMLRVHGSQPKYYHRIVGGNFRLDALQAAILRVKLKHLPRWIELRRHKVTGYRSLFREAGLFEHLEFLEDRPGHVCNQFVARFPERDRLRAFLRERGVGTAIYYPLPLHLQECFQDLGYQKGVFPVAESAAVESLALPLYPELTDEQQRYVVGQVMEFYEENPGTLEAYRDRHLARSLVR